MKELIKEIVNTFKKENRKNRKLVEEYLERIKELEANLEMEETRTKTFRNRVKQLERKNVDILNNYKDSLIEEVNNLTGHISKNKVIEMIRGEE